MAEFEIRRYEPGDADRVWEVHEEAFRATPIEFVEDADADEDLRYVESQYLDGPGEFLVGELVDVVAIGGFKPTDGEAVEIRRMRVHPDYQGRGYGRRLLKALEERARERGYAFAELETHHALDASQALYESHGYRIVNRETHPVAGEEFVHYRKEL